MSRVVTLALKDLRLLVRDWFGLFWILAFPLLMALFFGAIFGGMGAPGGNPLLIALFDEDNSDASRAFVKKIEASTAFRLPRGEDNTPLRLTLDQAKERVRKGGLVAYVILRPGFGKSGGFFGGPPKVIEVGIDPARRAEGEFLKGMLAAEAFQGMGEEFRDPKRGKLTLAGALKDLERVPGFPGAEDLKKGLAALERYMEQAGPVGMAMAPRTEPVRIDVADVTAAVDSRPRTSFEVTFPSSVLWGLLGCVAAFSISIVTERVQGTFLRLRTAPLTWAQVLLGKGAACFVAGVGVAVVLLFLAWLPGWVRIDAPLKLALAVVCAAACFTGLMMFVSTLGKTEQGVAGAGWGLMMPLAMIGGCMVPLIAMPGWMQDLSSVSPVKWGIVALEGAIWRGFSYAELLLPCGILLGVGAVFFLLGVLLLSRREA